MEDKIGLFQAFLAASDSFLLDLIMGLSEAGRVHEMNGNPPDIRGRFDGVPGRAGGCRDDGPVLVRPVIRDILIDIPGLGGLIELTIGPGGLAEGLGGPVVTGMLGQAYQSGP